MPRREADDIFAAAPLPVAPLDDAQRLACLRLIRSENVGPATFRGLVNHYGGAGQALAALPDLARRAGRGRPIRICPAAQAEAEIEAAAQSRRAAVVHHRAGLSRAAGVPGRRTAAALREGADRAAECANRGDRRLAPGLGNGLEDGAAARGRPRRGGCRRRFGAGARHRCGGASSRTRYRHDRRCWPAASMSSTHPSTRRCRQRSPRAAACSPSSRWASGRGRRISRGAIA